MPFLKDLDQSLKRLSLPVDAPVLVAYSGGLDSTALLRGLARLLPAASLRAAHVHHGLHPDADRWVEHCEAQCRDLGIPLECRHIQCVRRGGESQEDQARKGRYAALASLMQPGEWLMTAHHQQDQVETFFLQLFRGSGIAGLAAMKAKRPFAGGVLARPLLDIPREELEQFLLTLDVAWIEDPSNAALHHRRNRVRHQLLPLLNALEGRGVMARIARGAANLGDAKAVIEDVAAQDWALCGNGSGRLRRSSFRRISESRQRHALRHGIQEMHYPLPDRASLERLRAAMTGTRTGITLEWAGGRMWLHGDEAHLLPPVTFSYDGTEQLWLPSTGPCEAFPWQAELVPPGPGVRATGRAASTACHELHPCFFHQPLFIRYRQGGERYISLQGKTRTLKKALQERGIVPDGRRRVPLLYNQAGELLAVPGLFTCLPGLPPPGSTQVMRLFRI